MSESPCVQSVCRAGSIPRYVMVCAGTDIQSRIYGNIQKPGSFLANEKSKHQLIVQYLRDDGQVGHQSNLDTDTLIAQCVLQYAIEGSKVCCS